MTRTLVVRTLAAILALIAIPLATAQEVQGDDGGAAAILFASILNNLKGSIPAIPSIL